MANFDQERPVYHHEQSLAISLRVDSEQKTI
jgi:hypothetical protein